MHALVGQLALFLTGELPGHRLVGSREGLIIELTLDFPGRWTGARTPEVCISAMSLETLVAPYDPGWGVPADCVRGEAGRTQASPGVKSRVALPAATGSLTGTARDAALPSASCLLRAHRLRPRSAGEPRPAGARFGSGRRSDASCGREIWARFQPRRCRTQAVRTPTPVADARTPRRDLTSQASARLRAGP
jgi:hypothetical protein